MVGISAKIDKLSPSASVSDASEIVSSKESAKQWWKNAISSGTILALYTIAKSFESGKPITPETMFPDDLNWREFFSGFFEAIYVSPSAGIQVSRENWSGKGKLYKVNSIGSTSAKDLMRQALATSMISVKTMRPKVDSFFEEAVADNS